MGAVLGVIWWATEKGWPPAVAAAIVVAADLGLTGMLHLDGLVDSADGLLPHLEPARRLEVMSDPSVGAFGIAVGGAVILLRWSALFSTRPSVLLLAGIWAVSRASMAVAAKLVPYARRSGGLATAFLEGSGAGFAAGIAALLGLAGGLSCLVLWRTGPGLVVLAAELLAAAGVLAFAWRRIGGFTGDVLGAMGIVSETVALVVASARW
jgi:cobalamin synthase